MPALKAFYNSVDKEVMNETSSQFSEKQALVIKLNNQDLEKNVYDTKLRVEGIEDR